MASMALCSLRPYVCVSRHRPTTIRLEKIIKSSSSSTGIINPISFSCPFRSRALSSTSETLEEEPHVIDEPKTLNGGDYEEIILPSMSSSFNDVIAQLFQNKQYSTVVNVFSQMAKSGFGLVGYRPRMETMDAVIQSYSSLKNMELCSEEDDETILPSIFSSSNHLIAELHHKNQHSSVIFMFAQMVKGLGLVDYRPPIKTLNMVIESCSRLNHVKLGFSVLPVLLKLHGIGVDRHPDIEDDDEDYDPDERLSHTLSILLQGLCREGSYAKAIELFDNMVTHKLLSSAAIDMGVELFQKMVEDGHHLHHTSYYLTMFRALYAGLRSREVVKLMKQVLESGNVKPSVEWLNQLFAVLTLTPDFTFPMVFTELYKYMTNVRGVVPNSETYSYMFHLSLTEDDIDWVANMLELGILPDLKACNSLLNFFAYEKPIEAITLLGSMIRRGIEPCNQTIKTLIHCLNNHGDKFDAAEKYMKAFNKGINHWSMRSLLKKDRYEEALNMIQAIAVEDDCAKYLCSYLVEETCRLGRWDKVAILLDKIKEEEQLLGEDYQEWLKYLFMELYGDGKAGEALRLFGILIRQGVKPTIEVYEQLTNTSPCLEWEEVTSSARPQTYDTLTMILHTLAKDEDNLERLFGAILQHL